MNIAVENVIDFEQATFVVQNWMGRNLEEFDTLAQADDYKHSLSDDDSELEDYYIMGIDVNGNEFTPTW